jgi:outer membrane lipoprotein-sorting protein
MLRRLPTSRLLALLALVAVALAGGTAIAVAALGGGGPTPPPKPLDVAVHDAVSASAVDGVTARITFTNRLIDKSSLGAGSPLLSGATGRLWAAADGRLRVELQSDSGDAQVTSDGKLVTIYDGTQNTAYRITLPASSPKPDDKQGADTPPTLAKIDELLKNLAEHADVSGARPSDVADRAAYTVRVSPKHDGGLIGAGELAFDAANGTPLRAAVYAAGDSTPVLELKATDISFGKVADGDLAAPVPHGTKVTDIDLGGTGADAAKGTGQQDSAADQNDPKAIAAQLSFALSAPDTLVGLPRKGVRTMSSGADRGALVTYGAGLGGIAVLEQPAAATDAGVPDSGSGHDQALTLPKISIDGTSGQELATALGTVVRFARGGVQYTVIGSVPPAAAEAAARAL